MAAAGRAGEAFAVDLRLEVPPGGVTPAGAAALQRLAEAERVPLTVTLAPRAAALDGAEVVLCPGVPEAWAAVRGVLAACGWADAPAEGAGAVVAAALGAPALLGLAREVAARSAPALLVTLPPVPDILAGAARRRFGVSGLRAVGLGWHLEALRARLAALGGASADAVALVHGGVHRVGWVLRFAVEGREGYGELAERLGAASEPLAEVYRLTGLVPTVASGGWPWNPPGVAMPADDAPWAEPGAGEGDGSAVGRLVRAVATGEPAVIGLDVPFGGEALNWAPEVTVEVPAVVVGQNVEPVAVGPLPAGVDGLPRLLGLQRALASDYLAAAAQGQLLRALAATPQWGTPRQWRALAAALHERTGAALEAAVRP
jgi:alpha-galactosidase/6-phospho-beta-glucosidase family protein